LMNNGETGRLSFADGQWATYIDKPQRFGVDPYSQADFGQSELRVDTRGVAVGISTANQWWGPADRYPYVLGNNAAGFPHVFFGTSEPWNLWIAKVHGRIVYGTLDQSAYSPVTGPKYFTSFSQPGRRRIYSNYGFEVAGALVAERAEMSFPEYFAHVWAGTGMRLVGSAGSGVSGRLGDLAALAHELQAPQRVAPETLAEAVTVQFPGLDGVLPGFGRQTPNDWGLGFELRDGKAPHWTGALNSARTFGHFGRSGTFLWVDPDAGIALGVLTDRRFGDWAVEAWRALADAVLREAG